jgi:hypothetical protein
MMFVNQRTFNFFVLAWFARSLSHQSLRFGHLSLALLLQPLTFGLAGKQEFAECYLYPIKYAHNYSGYGRNTLTLIAINELDHLRL